MSRLPSEVHFGAGELRTRLEVITLEDDEIERTEFVAARVEAAPETMRPGYRVDPAPVAARVAIHDATPAATGGHPDYSTRPLEVFREGGEIRMAATAVDARLYRDG